VRAFISDGYKHLGNKAGDLSPQMTVYRPHLLVLKLILLELLISFYFFLYLFSMISRRTIISGSAGLIFAIFSLNESVFGADDGSVSRVLYNTLLLYLIFRFVKGRCHGKQIMLGETRK